METTPPFFGWDYPPSVCSRRPIPGRWGCLFSETKKAKDPRAVKRSKGPTVIASTTRLLSFERPWGVGGMGKPLKSADARSCIVESRGEK
jgi:hypothetical protein